MLIYAEGFPKGCQDSVRDAVGVILHTLRNPPGRLKLPQDLRHGLQTVLDGIQPFPSPTVSRSAMLAYDGRDNGPFAYSGGLCIWLCKRCFDAGQDRVNAVLFHELVHVMCGWELDAEVFENVLFHGQGATIPDPGDLEVFAQENWKGRWVRVVKDAGKDVVLENSWGEKILSLRQDLPDFFGTLTPDDLAGIPNG